MKEPEEPEIAPPPPPEEPAPVPLPVDKKDRPLPGMKPLVPLPAEWVRALAEADPSMMQPLQAKAQAQTESIDPPDLASYAILAACVLGGAALAWYCTRAAAASPRVSCLVWSRNIFLTLLVKHAAPIRGLCESRHAMRHCGRVHSQDGHTSGCDARYTSKQGVAIRPEQGRG